MPWIWTWFLFFVFLFFFKDTPWPLEHTISVLFFDSERCVVCSSFCAACHVKFHWFDCFVSSNVRRAQQPCSSESCLWARSTSITWELIVYAESQAIPQTCWVRICLSKRSRVSLCTAGSEMPCPSDLITLQTKTAWLNDKTLGLWANTGFPVHVSSPGPSSWDSYLSF